MKVTLRMVPIWFIMLLIIGLFSFCIGLTLEKWPAKGDGEGASLNHEVQDMKSTLKLVVSLESNWYLVLIVLYQPTRIPRSKSETLIIVPKVARLAIR